jgi:hypothetical protein
VKRSIFLKPAGEERIVSLVKRSIFLKPAGEERTVSLAKLSIFCKPLGLQNIVSRGTYKKACHTSKLYQNRPLFFPWDCAIINNTVPYGAGEAGNAAVRSFFGGT